MATFTAPRIALCSSTASITWSDGSLFTGFVLANLVLPHAPSGTELTEVSYGNIYPGVQLPAFQIIPVINGTYNTACGLFLNADIDPPGSKYIAFVYDVTKRKITGPSAAFAVTTTNAVDPIALGSLTMTVPSTQQAGVTPDI